MVLQHAWERGAGDNDSRGVRDEHAKEAIIRMKPPLTLRSTPRHA